MQKNISKIISLLSFPLFLASCSGNFYPSTSESIDSSTSDVSSDTSISENSASESSSSEICSESSSSEEASASSEISSSSAEISSESSSSEESSESSSSEASSTTSSGDPGDYYASISESLPGGINGEFRIALSRLIKPVSTPTYGGDGTGYTLSRQLQDADEDPNNPENMILFYTQASVKKCYSNGAKNWNREHCWPQNLSNGCWGKNDAGSDMLHIRPTYETTNGKRSNLKYGKSSGSMCKYNGYDYGRADKTYFEPLDVVKGDAARIIMYTWTAWKEYYGSKLPDVTSVFESVELMLEWHLNDLPSQIELNRNDFVQASPQKNRNPFVDHPAYACKIWGNTNAKTKALCGM